jgi:hypothetical protein
MADDGDTVGSDDINNMLKLSQEEIGYAGEIDQLMGSTDASEVSSAYGTYCSTLDQLRNKVTLGNGGAVTRAQFEEWNAQLGDSADQRRVVVTALQAHYQRLMKDEQSRANDLREQLRDKADRADKVHAALADAQAATDLVSKILLIHDTLCVFETGMGFLNEEPDPRVWLDLGVSLSAADNIESGVEGLAGYSVELEAVLQGWAGLSDMEQDIRTSVSALHDLFKSMQADAASLNQVNALPGS